LRHQPGQRHQEQKFFLLLFVYKKTSFLSFPPRMFVTRFAPSPTGFLHLGHAFSAWTAFSRARQAGGQFLLRLEDIDATRCKPEYAAAILEDLAWLGIAWDGEVRVQSAHLAEYAAALELLAGRGLLYPCFCSRSDILRAQSAPHGTAGVYPGTCRALSAAERRRRIESGALYALRLDMSRALQGAPALRFFEEGTGWVEAEPGRSGDAILARRDVPTSYHLCVVYDDALQGVTHVIRGEDLADATHVHVLLQHLLGWPAPVYAHHRLLTDAGGRRLAKRDFAATLRSMREAGESAESVLRKF
jgi:glutamyl-Q tRNA(Asp) synthetase